MASRTISPEARKPLVMHHPEIIWLRTFMQGDDWDSRKVIVAIPAYNSEVTIGSLVLRAQKHADHVIVIDRGSSDNTAEVVRLAGATLIQGCRNDENGKGIRDSFAFARRAGADILVLMDGDAPDSLEEISRQIRPILEGKADFVNGSLPVERKRSGDRKPRCLRPGREALALMRNVIRRRRIAATQNGFRAFSRKMFGCFTFSQLSTVSDVEALEIAEPNTWRKQVLFNGRSSTGRPAIDPFSRGTTGFNGMRGRLFRESTARLFCALGAGMILLGAGCIFLLMNHFNATHILGVEYGVGSMIFAFPGLALAYNGVMLRSALGIGKGK
jgi:glycosyltransferase involved in cell wall biosynthesis